MQRLIVVVLALLALGLVACAPDPVRQAKADAIRADTAIKRQKADLDLGIRAAVATAEIEARREAIIVGAETHARTMTTLATAVSVVLVIGALSAGVWALGYTVASMQKARQAARYTIVRPDPRTLLPPPYIITNDGWLVDTASGERAPLRSLGATDLRRLAATLHTVRGAQNAEVEKALAKGSVPGRVLAPPLRAKDTVNAPLDAERIKDASDANDC